MKKYGANKSLRAPAVSARHLATAEAPSSRPPSFGAFLAASRFEWDLSLAIVVPFSMAISIALSIDPRVAVSRADAADASIPRCELPPWEARADFPCGATMLNRVLHVFYHMAWYTLVRPARLGDWATVLSNALLLAWCAAMGLLSASRESGALWGWWRRWRSWVLLWAVYLARSSHLALAFLLLPAPAWTTHTWARYLTTACTSPVLNTLMLGLCDQVVKLPLPFIVATTFIQSITTFVLAYRLAPTILTLQHAQRNHQLPLQQDVYLASTVGGSSAIQLPVPLQCGVRPEHATLLSCRPVPLQLMIGLVMLVWPVWVSWHVEKRLRRQHAAVCDRWRQQQEQQQLQPRDDSASSGSGTGAPAGLQGAQGSRLPQGGGSGKPAVRTSVHGRVVNGPRVLNGTTRLAAVVAKASSGGSTPSVVRSVGHADHMTMDDKAGGSVEGTRVEGTKASPGKAALSVARPPATWHPAAKTLPVQPLVAAAVCTAPPLPTARMPLEWYRYQALTVTRFASIKVRDHPGTFEEYCCRMEAAAPAITKAALLSPQDSPVAAGLPAHPLSSPSSSSSVSSSPSATTASTSASGVLPPLTVVRSAVIRGCVQLVAWARGLRPDPAGAGHGLQDGGCGQAASRNGDLNEPLLPLAGEQHQFQQRQQQQQQQLRSLVTSLPQLLPGGFAMAGLDGAGVGMGVSVQVDGAMAAAGPPIGLPFEPTSSGRRSVLPEGDHNSVSHAAARLLQFSPAALPTPPAQAMAGAAGAPATALRLLLHSPVPQPARVLVLAECARGEQQDERQHAPGLLLAEAPVEMIAGTQEVELVLGPVELATAVEAARCGAVGVLQLVLVGPEHSAAGEAAAEQGEAWHAYPLVHWVAPPLLLLPPAAAAELCVVWEAMRAVAETPGGAVRRMRGGMDNGELSYEHESAVWWSHLAPLLGDLAYAFGDQVHGDAAAMEAVSAHLLPYLYDNGLQETAALLLQQHQQQPAGTRVGQPLCAAEDTCAPAPDAGSGRSLASRALPQSPFDELTNDNEATMRQIGPATPASPAANNSPLPTCSTPAPAKAASVPTRTGGPAVSATRGPSGPTPHGLLPPAPFSPHALELSYQAWRLAGMAAAAPYVLLLTAQPFALVAVRLARERGSVELLQGILLSFLSWATDACSSLVLLCLRARLTGTRDAYTASAVRQHYLAAVVYGPAIVVILTLLVIFRVLPYYAPYVGSVRLVLMCTLHRTVILPSVRQLSVRESWDKAPMLALGEALHVWIIQPGWHWMGIVSTAVVWRMGAIVVASMWEARSRRRFVQLLQQQRQQQQRPHMSLQQEQCSRGAGSAAVAIGENACNSGLGGASGDGTALAKGDKQP